MTEELRRLLCLYLRGLPAQEQVGGCDLIILHLGQRLLDFLQVVAHPDHHVCTSKNDQRLNLITTFHDTTETKRDTVDNCDH